MNLETLKTNYQQLSAKDQESFAAFILSHTDSAPLSAQQLSELERRVESASNGSAALIPAQQVFEQLSREFGV